MSQRDTLQCRLCAVSLCESRKHDEFEERAQGAWGHAGSPEERLPIAEWAAFFTFAYCHSLRGWEVVLATGRDLKEQIVSPERAIETGTHPHIGLPLFGRFKNCGNSSVQILCFLADRTASGLQPLCWAQRLLE